MNEHSNPLDYILRCSEQGLVPKLFTVENAKDELKRLREENKRLNSYFQYPVAYGMINDRLDVYNLRIQNNPYDNQEKIIPLYSNREEFLKEDWKGYHYGKSIK